MAGTLVTVPVKEGDWVTNGTVLAEVDAQREQAAVRVAAARLARVKAGHGQEEIAAAEANKDAIAAELAFAESEYQRAIKLREQQVVATDVLDERRQRAAMLSKQLAGAVKQFEAIKRGPLPEEIALAEAEWAAAQTAYELRRVRAQTDGAVLALYKHTGDFVSLSFPSPILRLANTRSLRVRIEVSEQDFFRVRTGMHGELATYGADKTTGHITVKTILPSFAPRRLFEPDSTARMDTRTLQVLCELAESSSALYSGQRITAVFSLNGE
jgi:HlyD family secretion protein